MNNKPYVLWEWMYLGSYTKVRVVAVPAGDHTNLVVERRNGSDAAGGDKWEPFVAPELISIALFNYAMAKPA